MSVGFSGCDLILVFVHVHGWVGRGYVSLGVQSRRSVGDVRECTV